MKFLEFEEVSVKEQSAMTEPHSHEFYELYFLLDGEREFFVENKMFKVSKNTIVVVPPFSLHKTEGGPYKRVNINISPELLSPFHNDFLMNISKEIAVSKLSKNDIDSKLLTKIAFEHDYEIAIGISAIYETFCRIIREGYEDYLYSDIALSFFESLYYWIESNKFLFNDFAFYNRCFESLQTIKEFIHQHAIDFVTVGTSREYTVPKKGIIEVSRCQINNPKAGIDTVWYEQKIKDFYSKFKLFIDYIKEKRYLVDTYVVD